MTMTRNDEDGKEEEEYDNACLWHDPFLEPHNLEMEIQDVDSFEMVQVAVGGYVVSNDGSIPDVPFAQRSWIKSSQLSK